MTNKQRLMVLMALSLVSLGLFPSASPAKDIEVWRFDYPDYPCLEHVQSEYTVHTAAWNWRVPTDCNFEFGRVTMTGQVTRLKDQSSPESEYTEGAGSVICEAGGECSLTISFPHPTYENGGYHVYFSWTSDAGDYAWSNSWWACQSRIVFARCPDRWTVWLPVDE